ncbi:MAG: M20/M25/M40 family metallo-hydrolase [Chloroflexia bacterium]
MRDEVTHHLQALLRINTVNPPGNETEAAQHQASVAREAGDLYEIAEGIARRGNFVARIKGNGTARPLILMGHTDVVSVEPRQVDPRPLRRRDRADGYIWGRGAIDMKNQVAANPDDHALPPARRHPAHPRHHHGRRRRRGGRRGVRGAKWLWSTVAT